MLSWAVAVALAGTPVVHEDGQDGAALVAQVVQRTGLPESQLTAVPLEALVAAAPKVLGDATLRRCARTGGPADAVRAELARAEAAFHTGDTFAAADRLDLAVALLGCLSELPDRKVAARVFQLRGALLAEEDPESAAGELRTARAFQPELEWDRDLPAAGAPLFAEAVSDPGAATLQVVPSTPTSGPWIDGRELDPAGVAVGAGLHLAQYAGRSGVESAWLVVAGDATFVLPGAFRRPILSRMADPEDRAEVEALIATALPDFHAAYVAWSGGLWLVTDEPTGPLTTEVTPPVLVEVALEEEAPRRRCPLFGGKRKGD